MVGAPSILVVDKRVAMWQDVAMTPKHCYQCGHDWVARVKVPPRCPSCMTRNWTKQWAEMARKDYSRSIFHQAVKDGRLLRPLCCSQCASTTRIEGHHEDYDKPLDVMWLCRGCHAKWHGRSRRNSQAVHRGIVG